MGINQYQEWPHLRTAVNDAKGLRDILVQRYGFADERTILLTDAEATRGRILSDLRNLASSLKDDDNLLVYFAGHGQLDDLTGDGYWIPVEGKQKDLLSWVAHSSIKNILSSDKVRGKNIVVVTDSCYSGTLLRGGPSLLSMEDRNYRQRLVQLSSKRSRQVITSGGLEPVVDGGRDGHSLFAYYLIRALEENDREVIDLENLFHSRVWKPVTEIGGQRPSVGRLKTPMDEDGQFVLELKIKVALPQSSVSTGTPEQDKELAEERERLARERREVERLELEIEKKRIEEKRKRLEEEKAMLEIASRPPSPQPALPTMGEEEVARDGVYLAYANGVVRDTNTGLEWVAGPDYEMTWDQAKSWVEGLKVAGAGWRMPTLGELEGLYERGKGNRNMTPLLKTTGWWVWSGEIKDSSSAWGLGFYDRFRHWSDRRHYSYSFRAFAVRSAAPDTSSRADGSQEVGRDGVYIAYANGIVRDTRTGLEWVAGPDKDMTWPEASKWVSDLDIGGGGWRMPTAEQLESLYQQRKGSRNMTPLLKTTGWTVWAGELKGSYDARLFFFRTNSRGWGNRLLFKGYRAFAVRSRSSG